MIVDRKAFFDGWRRVFGALRQGQVDGINALLAEMESSDWSDPRWFAYVLATVYHETGRSMMPLREFGRGEGHPYGEPDPETGQAYYGRGQVQLTWRENYRKLGERLKLPLETDPDLALRLDVSASICVEGMQHGLFTGKSLANYFDDDTDDPRNARRVVNGTDRADLIADHYRKILPIVTAAATADAEEEAPVPAPILITQPSAVPTRKMFSVMLAGAATVFAQTVVPQLVPVLMATEAWQAAQPWLAPVLMGMAGYMTRETAQRG